MIRMYLAMVFLQAMPSFAQTSLDASDSSGGVPAPLTMPLEPSAIHRWEGKKVWAFRHLDEMEDLVHWIGFTTGGEAIVDARATARSTVVQNVAVLSLTGERWHSGTKSLLLKMPVRLEGPAPSNGRGWGRSGIRRSFEGEDWSAYNRISLWIYPDLPGFYTTAMDFRLFNDGTIKLPGLFGQEGETSIVLKNHEWNHVLWEIGNVSRDKITSFEASYGLSGNAPGEADSIRFYFDGLDLERVDPDKIEGWDVWPGRISYSQAGYQPGAVKSAISNNLDATMFKLTDQQTGKVVMNKPIQRVHSHLGDYQVMDFSDIRTAGDYVLEAGGVRTHPFPIGPDVWEESIRKALNFFYAERCGAAIPGVHGVCHRDWACLHNGKRIMVNGGWHDAGDLSQSLGGTGEITYGMFSLAERLKDRDENPSLRQRVMEEARWGLDWILKTSFRDGYRDVHSINSRRTNDIVGDDDDVITTATNDPQANFVASAAEAIAARILKDDDPRLAAYSLFMAEEDWQFAVDGMSLPTDGKTKPIWTGTFDSDDIAFETASEGILASLDLWKATQKVKYEEKAVNLARLILLCQQRRLTDWDVPMTGFFYADSTKARLLHFVHRGRGQAHILALTGLCALFPNHPDWMKWYAAVTLYAEYMKKVASYTEPFDVLPASIYNDTEYLRTPESRRESFRAQVLQGIPLGKGNYLRLFPVWMDYRGHFGTILPDAQALASAAHLRGDLSSAQLATHQLEWVIGRNPFSESAMWGEGYDFTPLYSPSSGDIVGALPVGIQTRGDNDVPYWPVQSTWTYKEVWGHPTGRWIWLMRDLYGPSLIEGEARATVLFKERTTGQEIFAEPDSITKHFRIFLPEGHYAIHSDRQEMRRTFLPGGTYQLDLQSGHSVSFDLAMNAGHDGKVLITVKAKGTGKHHFSIRADNLQVSGDDQKSIELQPGTSGTLEWKTRLIDRKIPWVILVIPDDDLSQRQELNGLPSGAPSFQ